MRCPAFMGDMNYLFIFGCLCSVLLLITGRTVSAEESFRIEEDPWEINKASGSPSQENDITTMYQNDKIRHLEEEVARLRKLEQERRRSEEETHGHEPYEQETRLLRDEAEEARRRQAEAEEARRRQAEAEESRRRQAEAEESRRRQAEAEEAEEARRRQAEAEEAEEARRRQAEAEEVRRRQAEAEEAEEARRRQAEAEESRRRQAEAEESRRRQAEAEEAEEARRRQAEAEEVRRRQAEAEEAEEARRRQAEAEEVRRRQAEAEESRRRQAEAEEAEEARRRQAEAEEVRRRQAEAEEAVVSLLNRLAIQVSVLGESLTAAKDRVRYACSGADEGVDVCQASLRALREAALSLTIAIDDTGNFSVSREVKNGLHTEGKFKDTSEVHKIPLGETPKNGNEAFQSKSLSANDDVVAELEEAARGAGYDLKRYDEKKAPVNLTASWTWVGTLFVFLVVGAAKKSWWFSKKVEGKKEKTENYVNGEAQNQLLNKNKDAAEACGDTHPPKEVPHRPQGTQSDVKPDITNTVDRLPVSKAASTVRPNTLQTHPFSGMNQQGAGTSNTLRRRVGPPQSLQPPQPSSVVDARHGPPLSGVSQEGVAVSNKPQDSSMDVGPSFEQDADVKGFEESLDELRNPFLQRWS
ncbi:hypothetical protein LSM04_001385 [Trypanosoma melophagium]|uniref:uncharacterized protein n=1 Tax=Trypanosoma melophagium TaxID=715481 RepID=UPI00351A0984|nr:hypothetical protein LSM04_001385 [Trypanosoma melophagium]